MIRFLFVVALLAQQSPTPIERVDTIILELQELRRVIEPPPVPPPPPQPPPPPPPPPLPVVHVPAGGNLQAALDAATDETTVTLAPKAVYPGPVTCRRGKITTQAFAPPLVVGTSALAVVTSPNGQQAIRIDGRCTLVGLEVRGNGNDLVWLTANADLTITHVYIHGSGDSKNGLTLNGTAVVRDNVIDDIYRVGQESHCIVGFEGGPYTIERNQLSCASINLMFGGDDPSAPDRNPHDITIRHNTFAKKLAWRGLGYAVKNLLELKNARRVTITDNTFDYSWVDGQIGYGIVFSIRNQGCRPAFATATIEDVLFERNIVRHVSTGLSILGQDDTCPSQRMARVTIQHNRFEDINASLWGRVGTASRGFIIAGGSDQLHILNNVTQGTGLGSFLYFYGPRDRQHVGFRYEGNDTTEGRYGLHGDSCCFGRIVLDTWAPGASWSGNTVRRTATAFTTQTYPPGTTVVP